ncbi:putative LRR receptor-like serine/threonine-protein kinase [Dorcoceras hygrometricum]|uniref:Putative LRR receptor-like serine/threonine-protein kinase n=1 Tax=Dorcoceras hygrometricum TaxID=472368 RepID=A0A2Z7CYR7_9LAMI|nr:putative LRR receptor-like serine/threonine-protein kinase [Dorcoceras hygrometricum]
MCSALIKKTGRYPDWNIKGTPKLEQLKMSTLEQRGDARAGTTEDFQGAGNIKLVHQLGPRPEGRLLRQPALEGLKTSTRTDSPRKTDRSKSDQLAAAVEAGGGGLERREAAKISGGLGSAQRARVQMTISITTTSLQLRSPIRSDRSTQFPKLNIMMTNQYNQDLGLIHSTNGNHLESPNEGSSIDNQVTIYLHAQNITMFPTNATWSKNMSSRWFTMNVQQLVWCVHGSAAGLAMETSKVDSPVLTLAMSLFDLQDVRIAIGSIATLDLPMVVDLIGIYGLKGPYCTLTTTNWFLQALSVIPRGSWGDVARRSYHDPQKPPPPLLKPHAVAAGARRRRRFAGNCFGQSFEENPSVPISSGLLVQADEGVTYPVVDLIDVIYLRLP